MKKQLLIATLASAACLLILRGNASGPSAVNHYDCTGGESAGVGAYVNPTGCSAAGASCHGSVGGSTATILVALELDSAGMATTHYKAGMSYTVTITGTNTSGLSLPFYGFQLASLADSVSTSSNADAGTWATTGLPAHTHRTAPSTLGTQLTIMEHSSAITVPSPGTIFTETFTWTAPAAGTGTISFWGAANFVNGDALASALDKWNSNSLIIHEWTIPTAVATVTVGSVVNVYPNPVQNELTISSPGGFATGSVVQVYDLTGKVVQSRETAGEQMKLDMRSLPAGLYQVLVPTTTGNRVVPVVRQ